MRVLRLLCGLNFTVGLLGLSLNGAKSACCGLETINVALLIVAVLNVVAGGICLSIIIRNRSYAP